MLERFETRPMTADEIETAVQWAAAEGWNPGLDDAACFSAQDPEGFIGGYLDGRMVASISVVNYGETLAFLGFYIVHPDYRGKGLGYALWQAGIAHAGKRLIGLDGVPAEQENYKRSGFVFAYRNVRFGGMLEVVSGLVPPLDVATEPVSVLSEEIEAFDRALFPADRQAFLAAWLRGEGHIARVARRRGAVVGLGVARPCRSGWKIGPLFADDTGIAEALLDDLLETIGKETGEDEVECYLDVPEPNAAAVDLARRLGMEPGFETARMYTGPAPELPLDRIFGVSSFELG
jgi:ribosomal protein S18 acetylase RimI-like enzyme